MNPRSIVVGTALPLALASTVASARPTGEPQECANCHYEDQGPLLEIGFGSETPAPGETVLVTIDVEATADDALRTGLFLNTNGQGAFTLIGSENMRFAQDGDPSAVVHAQPRDLDGAGRAQFQVEWTTPDSVGVTELVLWSMTGNTNGDSADDNHATIRAQIAHGCEPITLYDDLDGDGFGDEESAQLSCEPIEGMIEQGGDCNDGDPQMNPSAEERCNAVDDDCDGEADEGLEPGIYYPDPDGDGYSGDPSSPEFTCNDAEGYASELGDCEPDDPNVYPGAPELANGQDDDCDGEIDEDVVEGDDSGGDESGGSGGPAQNGSGDGGGCSTQGRAGGPGALVGLMLAGLLGRRRRSGPA